MRIAISATNPSLDAEVDERFGRCTCFAVIDPESRDSQFVDNPNIGLGSGAGIQTARLLADHQVTTVLTGNCGPNAWQTLAAADISVILGCKGTIRQVVDSFKAGELHPADAPNAAGSAHKPAASPNEPGPQAGRNPGQGRGCGGGRGFGQGRGRGMGQGSGRGRGRGK